MSHHELTRLATGTGSVILPLYIITADFANINLFQNIYLPIAYRGRSLYETLKWAFIRSPSILSRPEQSSCLLFRNIQ